MPRSWQEIYAEIVRLPAPARLRLLARLLADLAVETEGAAASGRPAEAAPAGGAPGSAPVHPAVGTPAAAVGAAPAAGTAAAPAFS